METYSSPPTTVTLHENRLELKIGAKTTVIPYRNIASVDVDRDGNRITGTITLYYPPADLPPFESAPGATATWGKIIPTPPPPSGPPPHTHKLNFSAPARSTQPL